MNAHDEYDHYYMNITMIINDEYMIIKDEYNNDYSEKMRYYIGPFKNLPTHQEMINLLHNFLLHFT